MAQHCVTNMNVSIRLVCQAFSMSESCYRYKALHSDENILIADRLIQLTHEQTDWGFGQCFQCLRNVEGRTWHHKHVYRIYCELALNMIDDYRREGLAIEAGFSLPTVRVIRVLNQ